MESLAAAPADLLAEARAAGLSVSADGDRLVVRGAKEQGALVERLFADKAGMLAALTDEAEVAWRVAAMAPRIPASGTIPILEARPCAPGPTDCVSCGDPMEAGQRYRCRACAEAVRRVVAADEAECAARRSTGGQP